MRILFLLLLLAPYLSYSQKISVRSIQKVTDAASGELSVAGISPDGLFILATSPDLKGLKIIDLSTKNIREITSDAGAGYEPIVTPGGDKIFYRSDEYINLRKYSSLHEFSRAKASRTVVEPLTRRLGSPVISGGKLIYSTAGKQKAIPLEKDAAQKETGDIYLVLEDLAPVLYVNGSGRVFKPNGEGNYIWASLSPDKTMILYNYGGKGTFVADTAGKITGELGRLDAPRWITDDLIVGMNDRDDGERVLSSDICCYSLKTKKLYNLTGTENEIEMYPWPVPGNKQIIFQTLKGEIFLMNIRIR